MRKTANYAFFIIPRAFSDLSSRASPYFVKLCKLVKPIVIVALFFLVLKSEKMEKILPFG